MLIAIDPKDPDWGTSITSPRALQINGKILRVTRYTHLGILGL